MDPAESGMFTLLRTHVEMTSEFSLVSFRESGPSGGATQLSRWPCSWRGTGNTAIMAANRRRSSSSNSQQEV